MFGNSNEVAALKAEVKRLKNNINTEARKLFTEWTKSSTEGMEYVSKMHELTKYKAKCEAYEQCMKYK